MSEKNSLEGIAVIGLSGRFPKAAHVGQFWAHLAAGKNCFSEFSVEHIVGEGVPRAVAEDPNYVRRAPVIEDPAGFDARAFKYSPKEAELIDPQQRMLLECAWTAFENAGHDPHRFPGLIGIWAGIGINNYLLKNILPRNPFESAVDFQTIISNEKDYLASRIAYKMNLRGPAVVVQTACSTSLVAVNMACLALLTYQCDMALAGAVFLQTPRARGYLYREGEIFSPDGYCRTFDKRANGTVLGEGCGLVVLRRLEDAVADGDDIWAVIRGSAVNNDGAERAGYTAPGVRGQIDLVTTAQTMAGVDPDEISYIEAHGTGTPLGDPIEISALTQVFRRSTREKNFCGIGSVKTNIGHLDVAAGVAGLIKTVCALRYHQIPPTINFTEPNPELQLPESPFYVVDRLMEWQPRHGRRVAGVSSFGMGGTNAHVIVEEYPSRRESEPSRRSWQLFPISAVTSTALNALEAHLSKVIDGDTAAPLADVAWTLIKGRPELLHRRCVVSDSPPTAARYFAEPNAIYKVEGQADRGIRPVVLMFSGQGTQYASMGAELYRTESVFRENLERCSRLLGPIHADQYLVDILYHGKDGENELINQTAVSQIVLFAFEYSLVRLLESYGVRPAAVVGHSIGEYVAACEAGVFSLEDALDVVRERGRLMQSMPPGAMIAVPRSEKDIKEILPESLDLAVVNSPSITVVSGAHGEIERFQKSLEQRGIQSRKLQTSHGFHSRSMENAAQALKKIFLQIRMHPPQLPLASNVSGAWMTAEQSVDPEYWARHLRQTCRFGDNLEAVSKRFGSCVLLEVGAGNTLCSIAKQHTEAVAGLPCHPTVRHPRQQAPDQAIFLRALGALWCHGAEIDLRTFYSDERRRTVPLPTYPFEHEQLWISSQPQEKKRISSRKIHLPLSSVSGRLRKNLKSRQERTPRVLKLESLTELWRDVLGMKILSPDENFFEVGGHSLLAAKMFALLKEKFGISAPLSTLFNNPTARQLLGQLLKSNEQPWRSLVAMETGGDRIPLFLVHGAEGNILLYRELTKYVQPDQPVFGLQCKGVDGRGVSHRRIEDMAADYVAEIMEFYPEGPLLVGGYCMGGTVALEMAQQLTRKGRVVPLILSIESYHYRQCGVNPTPLLLRFHNLQDIWFHLDSFLLAGMKKGRGFLAEKFRVEKSRLMVKGALIKDRLARSLRLKKGDEFPHVALSKINDAAYFAYEPKTYEGRVAVFRPKRQFIGYDKFDGGWGKLAPGRVEVIILPAYPRSMLVEPFVEELGRRIRKTVDRVQRTGK